MPVLQQFDNDVMICHVGNFLRKHSGNDLESNSRWLLDLKGYPKQSYKTTLLSNLPLLARGRRINPTRKYGLKANFSLAIQSSRQFQPIKLSKYASRLYPQSKFIDLLESEQWAFQIVTKNCVVIIPQLEMARSFLLVNSYLSRACMSTSFIDMEFDSQFDSDSEEFRVHFTKASTFPISGLESVGVRKMIAWILFNKDVLDSLKSIYRYYMSDRYVRDVWQLWTFRFDLPDLSGWKMQLRGRYLDKSQKLFYVEEIMKLYIASPVPKTVIFSGDMFNELEIVEGLRSKGNSDLSPNDEFNVNVPHQNLSLDDIVEANSNLMAVFYEDEYAKVEFKHPINTSIKNHKKGVFPDGLDGEDESQSQSQVHEQSGETNPLSTAIGHLYGNGRQADLGSRMEDTDYPLEPFEAFDAMVGILTTIFGWACKQSENISLNRVGRSRLHKLKGSNITRQIKTVLLAKSDASGQQFLVRLLELNTSDGVKAISTKILQEPDMDLWCNQLNVLKEELVKNSLSWPNDVLNKVCRSENKNKSLIHPRHQGSEFGVIIEDEIDSWAKRANVEMSKVSVDMY